MISYSEVSFFYTFFFLELPLEVDADVQTLTYKRSYWKNFITCFAHAETGCWMSILNLFDKAEGKGVPSDKLGQIRQRQTSPKKQTLSEAWVCMWEREGKENRGMMLKEMETILNRRINNTGRRNFGCANDEL